MIRFLSFLIGPIFAKEMVEMARRKRYYFNRVIFGAVLLFSLFLTWESERYSISRDHIRGMARLAENMFITLSCVQYGAVFVFVPLFLCGVIASEREEQTLDLLFTTQLRDREIILGKLLSRLTALFYLVLVAVPITSMLTLWGGVDPSQFYRVLTCTLFAMLLAGAVSIYFSAITKSPMGALIRTYWWLAVWNLGIPLGMLLIVSSVTPGPTAPLAKLFFGYLLYFNPFAAFICSIEGNAYNFMAGIAGEWFFPTTFVTPALLSVVLIWRAVLRLRLAPTPFGKFWGRIRSFRALGEFRKDLGEFQANRRRDTAHRLWSIFPVRNPLWLRARMARIYDREGYIGRIQLGCWFAAGVFILLMLFASRRQQNQLPDEATIVFLVPTWIAYALMAVVIAGISVVGDRRRGFFEKILVTPLSARSIVDGTILAVWTHLRRLYWLPIALCALFALITRSTLAGILCSITTATLFSTLLIIHGVGCSLPAKSVPAALIPTFLFPILAIVGITFYMPIFREASGPALWITSGVFLAGSLYWLRRRVSSATVGAFFMATYLCISCAATCWAWSPDRSNFEWPIAAMHPGFLTVVFLESNYEREFRRVPPAPVLFSYWSALLVNIIWARWWLIRNFEKLVERAGCEKAQPPTKAETRPIVSPPEPALVEG